jgi:tetratricopeptide (TPR) repeat protein
MPLQMSTLELEAAVQRDPKNVQAWYALGVKQQDNEREQKAIEALCQAVELDPEYVPSWLALGVSHTNESNRAKAYGAIREWVKRHPRFPQTAAGLSGGFTDDVLEPGSERIQKAVYEGLIACLIEMIRNASGSEEEHRIDPDVQIALAVLLNSNEEYAKATDCFLTALAVRPHVRVPQDFNTTDALLFFCFPMVAPTLRFLRVWTLWRTGLGVIQQSGCYAGKQRKCRISFGILLPSTGVESSIHSSEVRARFSFSGGISERHARQLEIVILINVDRAPCCALVWPERSGRLAWSPTIRISRLTV